MAINTTKAIWDYGVEAETNPITGDLNIYENEDAVNNAIKTFFLTNEGEILNNPYNGGALLPYVFAPMTVDTYRELIFYIKTKVLSEFSPAVKLINLKINPNFDKKSWDIAITYQIQQFNATKTVTFELTRVQIRQIKDDIKQVALTGKILYNFILAYLYDLYGVSLKWNGTYYQWGDKFIFTGLTPEDEYYDRILETINANRKMSSISAAYVTAYIKNGQPKLGTDATLLNPILNYTMTVILDKIPQTVTISGSTALTVSDLIKVIQAKLVDVTVTLSSESTFEVAGTKIVFTANKIESKSLRIADGTLIAALYGGGASI